MMSYCHSMLLKVGVILTNLVKPAIFTLHSTTGCRPVAESTISLEASTFLEYLFPDLGSCRPGLAGTFQPQAAQSCWWLGMQFSSLCFPSPAVNSDCWPTEQFSSQKEDCDSEAKNRNISSPISNFRNLIFSSILLGIVFTINSQKSWRQNKLLSKPKILEK